jgi:hypothetical protein
MNSKDWERRRRMENRKINANLFVGVLMRILMGWLALYLLSAFVFLDFNAHHFPGWYVSAARGVAAAYALVQVLGFLAEL